MSRLTSPAKLSPAVNKRAAFRLFSSIHDGNTRNLLRGLVAQNNDKVANVEGVNSVRKTGALDDLHVATSILIGNGGAFPFSNTGGTYQALLKPHRLTAVDPQREVAFIAGHLNGWESQVHGILGSLLTLRELPTADPSDGLEALGIFAQQWGASNVLAKKVAYVIANHDDDLSKPFETIANIVNHSEFSTPYFTALESIDPAFPYFSSMHTRVNVYRRYVDDDYRQILPLHNISGSPIDIEDLGRFLRKCHSMSLVDEVVGVLQILHNCDQFPAAKEHFKRYLNTTIWDALINFSDAVFHSDTLVGKDPADGDSRYYRNSLAFLEFRNPAQYRQFVDRIVAPRLLSDIVTLSPLPALSSSVLSVSRKDLTKALYGFRKHSDHRTHQNVGTFLRSIQFLQFLDSSPTLSSLTHYDVRYIFEHTTSLDVLLTAAEIEGLYLSVDDASRPLVSVFAVALHKARAHSDDVDFKFRLFLSNTILSKFEGRIEKFIEWLVQPNPQIANYMISILDRATLQKMYWLVGSASEADSIRMRILQIVGKALERIEYFVEADSIEAQRQVSRLRKFFDESRIFVDGIAMKRWLVENPSSYAQQYARVIENLSGMVPATVVTIEEDGSAKRTQTEISMLVAHDYILLELAKIVFEQFCTNVNFGIESYLSRRIRHNTMSGMMRGGVDSVIERPQYRALNYDPAFMGAYRRWLEEYRSLIDTLRADFLQFRCSAKPRGLFVSELRLSEELTTTNIILLRKAAWSAKGGHELLNELLIRFCWREIDPQLDAAAKFITGEQLQKAKDLIERHLGSFADQQVTLFASDLSGQVHDRFMRLASWFRQPESGFVKASTRELGDLIHMEVNEQFASSPLAWTGSAVDVKMDGLSVHRVYDCLSVLIRNAARYGRREAQIAVNVDQLPSDKTNIARFNIQVSSVLPADREVHLERLREGFADGDLGASMVKEGYSGIKKMRFIVNQSEGVQAAGYVIRDDVCDVFFTLTVEKAADDELPT